MKLRGQLIWTLPAMILAGGVISCQNKSATPAAKSDDSMNMPMADKDSGASNSKSSGMMPMMHGPMMDNKPMAPATPAAPAPAMAPAMAMNGVSGSWKWSVDAGGTPINHSAKFVQSGQTLSGTWTDSYGDQPVTADIKDGTVKDGQVSFKVSRPSPFGDAGQMLTLSFSGKLDASNDKIDGTINIQIPGADAAGGDVPPTEWHATRVKE